MAATSTCAPSVLPPSLRQGARGCSLLLMLALSSSGCEDEETGEEEPVPDVETLSFAESMRFAELGAAHAFAGASVRSARELGLPLGAAGGIAAADVDGDGLDDLLTLGGDLGAKLLLNRGDGSFADASDDFELALDPFDSGPLLVDLDADLDPDLVVANLRTGSVRVFDNDDGRFVPSTGSALAGDGDPAVAIAADDLDGDLDVDLFVARFGSLAPSGLLWINDGTGRFEDRTDALLDALEGALEGEPFALTAPSFVDLDHDGRRELVLAGTQGSSLVLANEGTEPDEPRFVVRERFGGDAASLVFGDLNNDDFADGLLAGAAATFVEGGSDAVPLDAGALDAGALDAGASGGSDAPWSWRARPNQLWLNDREGNLEPWPADAGLEFDGGPGTCIADFNNDGSPDLLQLSTNLGGARPTRLLLQQRDGSGTFVDATSAVTLSAADDTRAVLCFDHDRDGDVDMFAWNHDGPVRLYENALDPGTGPAHFFEVRLEGSAESPHVAGARVSIVAGRIEQTREVRFNSGHLAQAPMHVHFGLRAVEWIDQLRIRWPDGTEDTLIEGLSPNDVLNVRRR